MDVYCGIKSDIHFDAYVVNTLITWQQEGKNYYLVRPRIVNKLKYQITSEQLFLLNHMVEYCKDKGGKSPKIKLYYLINNELSEANDITLI